MSKNVELVRAAYAGFGRGDIPSVLAILTPDIEWVESTAKGIPTRGTHRGPGAVAQNVFATIPQNWETFALETQQFLDAGEQVIVLGRVHAQGKSGKRLDAPFAHVFTVSDGKVKKMVNYHDTALWLEALA